MGHQQHRCLMGIHLSRDGLWVGRFCHKDGSAGTEAHRASSSAGSRRAVCGWSSWVIRMAPLGESPLGFRYSSSRRALVIFRRKIGARHAV
ncbi:hypothetical protein G1C95_1955 [Bifidobacterium sp. DSM 109957]|uniref:Uncharacterized protein n=1 Tax=Bifidobacterium oedipodis TaxID=2675322 RepID=A0A7Y0EQW2_9BIFI|nr:hypothetical protein [Bifidobacterium sp. DSM 109957]